jgi:hypothetical protein
MFACKGIFASIDFIELFKELFDDMLIRLSDTLITQAKSDISTTLKFKEKFSESPELSDEDTFTVKLFRLDTAIIGATESTTKFFTVTKVLLCVCKASVME